MTSLVLSLPTNISVTISLLSITALELYYEHSTTSNQYSDQTAIEQYANRVANAVQQTVGHIAKIQAGEPALQDFADHDFAFRIAMHRASGSVYELALITFGI